MSTVVIVGVTPGQPDAVVLEAAVVAAQFHAELVCATVDAGRYLVDEYADGSIMSLPVDPDLLDLDEEGFPIALRTHLATLLDGRDLVWSTRAVAGDPARALAHLADSLNAALIVVGTRERGMRASLQEFFGGSVAVHLAHRQHRPVLVIPLAPVAFRDELPWESGD
ncbi:universal stress protein [Cryobacterium sp. PH29-G1]|uniref:universal stress protein n=1 Tax=Cryobacterium sp. PH29-G1 TaxID=3046211 RepID=UPI0024BBC70C|nr:universal stress protein [Cryobacterium sp. PH29-G1]MDJ0350097.1 universal stress protein [Cryobacterium sp. PH29-G1]